MPRVAMKDLPSDPGIADLSFRTALGELGTSGSQS